MCYCVPAKFIGNQCPTTTFTQSFSDASCKHTISLTKCIYTKNDEVNIRIEIEYLFKLFNHSITKGVVIVTKGVLPIHAMDHRLTLGICFKAEGYVPVTVCLHLFNVEDLNGANRIFHLLNHIGAVVPVIGGEVNHPYRAGVTDVQICRKGSGIAAIRELVRMQFVRLL